MRISDWSSDVCSSDLHLYHVAVASRHLRGIRHPDAPLGRSRGTRAILRYRLPLIVAGLLGVVGLAGECGARCGEGYAEQGIETTVFHEIGRGSCRERVGQYVSNSVVAVPLNKRDKQK